MSLQMADAGVLKLATDKTLQATTASVDNDLHFEVHPFEILRSLWVDGLGLTVSGAQRLPAKMPAPM